MFHTTSACAYAYAYAYASTSANSLKGNSLGASNSVTFKGAPFNSFIAIFNELTGTDMNTPIPKLGF